MSGEPEEESIQVLTLGCHHPVKGIEKDSTKDNCYLAYLQLPFFVYNHFILVVIIINNDVPPRKQDGVAWCSCMFCFDCYSPCSCVETSPGQRICHDQSFQGC